MRSGSPVLEKDGHLYPSPFAARKASAPIYERETCVPRPLFALRVDRDRRVTDERIEVEHAERRHGVSPLCL